MHANSKRQSPCTYMTIVCVFIYERDREQERVVQLENVHRFTHFIWIYVRVREGSPDKSANSGGGGVL